MRDSRHVQSSLLFVSDNTDTRWQCAGVVQAEPEDRPSAAAAGIAARTFAGVVVAVRAAGGNGPDAKLAASLSWAAAAWAWPGRC